MAITCAVKLSNTIVEKATVSSTDALKLLELVNSTIKEADLTMLMVTQSAPFMPGPPITLDASELTVTTADMEQLTEMEENFIFSQNHSKAYFKALTTPPEDLNADPTWTYDTDDTPTYGNALSYNIRPFSYVPFSANPFQFWLGDGYELTVGIILADMGSATTIRATAEWQDRNDPGWNLMEVDGGGDTFVDITGLVGEYEALFSGFIPGCGNYDIRVTLIDEDDPQTLIQLEENPNNLQCG